MSKSVSSKIDSQSVDEPSVYVEAGSEGSLTSRQRTKVEKRDQAVADPAEDGDKNTCDNHPDREATESTDGGGAHSTQYFCEECAARRQ